MFVAKDEEETGGRRKVGGIVEERERGKRKK
jgi:hypothetical protein